MNEQLAAVALRIIQFSSTAVLTQYNTLQMPNGALAYDQSSGMQYRLQRNVGDEFDSLNEIGYVIKPGDQSQNRWIAEYNFLGSPYYFGFYLNDSSTPVIMTSNQWRYLGTNPSTYAVNAGQPNALFALDAEDGELIYNGPTKTAKVTFLVSVNNGIGSTPVSIRAAISRDEDVVEGTTNSYKSLGEVYQTVTDSVSQIVVERVVALVKGTSLRLAFRNATNGDDIVVNSLQCFITPV